MKYLKSISKLILLCAFLLVGTFSCTSASERMLAEAIKGMNEDCPQKLEKGFIQQSVTLENNNCIITFELDENYYDFSYIKNNANELIEDEIQDLENETDEDIKFILGLMKHTKTNYVSRYVSKQTKEKVDIVVPYSELP